MRLTSVNHWRRLSGIGNEDGGTAGRKPGFDPGEKLGVRAPGGCARERMHLFIQGYATPFQRHRGAQQLEAEVGRQVRPVNEDQRCLHRGETVPGERFIHVSRFGVQRTLTSQAIDAFDVVLDGNTVAQPTPEFAQCQAAARQRCFDGGQEACQSLRVYPGAAPGKQSV